MLEKRKQKAKTSLNLFVDVIEMRGSVRLVNETLPEPSANNQHVSLESLETAAHFLSKSLALMQVIEDQVTQFR